MARSKMTTLSPLLVLNLICLALLVSAGKEEEEEDGRFVNAKLLLGVKKEKLSHFRFYWHDTLKGPNASAVRIVNSPSKFLLKSGFGTINMVDNPLTEAPELSSKLLRRAQGFYGVASQEEVSLLMAMTFGFVQGKYNGSTISVFGRNSVFKNAREMPVIGGSGLFRFARGYAQATTYSFDTVSGNAVVEYNVYLLHYLTS